MLAYRDWLQEQESSGKTNAPEMSKESLRRHAFLDGMAGALGLSEKEEITIMREIGFIKKITK